jgi:hypothetical protein
MADDPRHRSQRDPGQGQDTGQGQGAGQGQDAGQGQGTGRGQGRDPARGRGPAHASPPRQRGSAQGTATMTREERPRGAPPRTEHREPHRSLLPILAGLLGVLALGGLIAGLVVSHAPSTPTAARVPTTTRTLSTFASRGDASAPSFTTPSTPLTAHYSYSCPAGTTGHFVARFETAAGSAIRNIVSSTALTGSGATTVTAPPPPVGTPYHVAVSAPSGGCTYHIITTTT